MIINGEKYACEACVRGHRVSNCQHSDRPLQHINKKGRPVSQCQHCRAMRKSRSAHVKCDCGEKTSKCIHLRAPQEGHRETCCCNHGGRCTCAHKKELNHLDTVPESESNTTPSSKPTRVVKAASASTARRRANTVHSDSGLTFDEKGHHKPTHRGVKASQKCAPYQRSSATNRDMTHSRSETTSPQLSSPPPGGSPSFPQLNPGLPPLDLSSIEYTSYVSGFDMFSHPEEQPAMFSAGLRSASVDWSGFDGLPSYGTSSFGQSSGPFDFGSDQSGLTNSTNSGDVSEAEDINDGFRLSTNSGHFLGLTPSQAQILSSPDVNNLTFDDFLKTTGGNKYLMEDTFHPTVAPTSQPSYSMTEDAMWATGFANEGIATMPDSPLEPGVGTDFWACS